MIEMLILFLSFNVRFKENFVCLFFVFYFFYFFFYLWWILSYMETAMGLHVLKRIFTSLCIFTPNTVLSFKENDSEIAFQIVFYFLPFHILLFVSLKLKLL